GRRAAHRGRRKGARPMATRRDPSLPRRLLARGRRTRLGPLESRGAARAARPVPRGEGSLRAALRNGQPGRLGGNPAPRPPGNRETTMNNPEIQLTPGELWNGALYPLGATWDGEGVNFAVYSRNADKVELCLYDENGKREMARIPLRERTDFVWHGYLPHVR